MNDVFYRCPEWAIYHVVNENGDGYYLDEKPVAGDGCWIAPPFSKLERDSFGIHTAEVCSNWKHSLAVRQVVTKPVKPDAEPSALDIQVGGDHYKKLKIQPMEYSMANDLDACQHTAIKYITRFRDKGGIADLRKAIHTIEMLIQFEERKNNG